MYNVGSKSIWFCFAILCYTSFVKFKFLSLAWHKIHFFVSLFHSPQNCTSNQIASNERTESPAKGSLKRHLIISFIFSSFFSHYFTILIKVYSRWFVMAYDKRQYVYVFLFEVTKERKEKQISVENQTGNCFIWVSRWNWGFSIDLLCINVNVLFWFWWWEMRSVNDVECE